MKNPLKPVCIRLPSDLHKEAKLYACEMGITLQELITELLKQELIADQIYDNSKCEGSLSTIFSSLGLD